MRLLVALLFAVSSACAQHSSQPAKESAADLRVGVEVFRIEEPASSTTVWLERTAGLDYFLVRKTGEDDEKILKVSSVEARRLEQEFAAKFLRCQYELPTSAGDCRPALRLFLKGDPQEICGKDEGKTQELAPFIKSLTQRF